MVWIGLNRGVKVILLRLRLRRRLRHRRMNKE
jgi:hypothetical protein